jgi:ABC-type molybdate transport system substrate-binding protein
MQRDDIRYQTYLKILKEELVPAMGCTEPIALAYGSAKAKKILGTIPDKVVVQVSSNIIKNDTRHIISCVIYNKEDERINEFLNFILTFKGQKLVEECGFESVR